MDDIIVDIEISGANTDVIVTNELLKAHMKAGKLIYGRLDNVNFYIEEEEEDYYIDQWMGANFNPTANAEYEEIDGSTEAKPQYRIGLGNIRARVKLDEYLLKALLRRYKPNERGRIDVGMDCSISDLGITETGKEFGCSDDEIEYTGNYDCEVTITLPPGLDITAWLL